MNRKPRTANCERLPVNRHTNYDAGSPAGRGRTRLYLLVENSNEGLLSFPLGLLQVPDTESFGIERKPL
jgi:hypothetical protein